MSEIAEQYDAYPYPARDPEDERRRLVTGSPSWLPEVEHFLFAGRRDWSRPFRVLVAGGGTGDGLIQLAALLDHDGRAAEITYLDLSRAARDIAERRAAVRGLSGIRFVTGDLLTAPELGRFDYIDCCGVLHHLPEPQTGFDALAAALDPGGGIGLMVYAPHGRSGVYPLQEAFRALLGGLPPAERLARARRILEQVPAGHPFRRNPHLSDHLASDAGFYDLLLHSQDRAFAIDELAAMLGRAGLALIAPATPALYDLARLLPEGVAAPEALGEVERMALAERLRGTIRTHAVYAAPAARAARARARGREMGLVPLLRGLDAAKLARQIERTGRVTLEVGGASMNDLVPADAAPLVARIDGRRSLAEIAAQAGSEPLAFLGLWGRVDRVLGDWGLMHYCSPAPA
ncbi:class I SAM-dependent methyltransferase [Rhodosalinus halophilus]|uniref:Class I SAM-dependent methyltransferase n=1 Tax=Rhodosalinus halophilus TaxID=2259333 RepID=A0A365UDT1_9RHOB|nr:class I SAM-dependent methyltransferase [Rhodosalinus halophilus]RBI87708.1 class I SAM-dependent methyltransferase [Rhodosalinus halophilus]